jgi:hypothetical protein
MSVEPLQVPRFSLAERDQRWRRVRQVMEREGRFTDLPL